MRDGGRKLNRSFGRVGPWLPVEFRLDSRIVRWPWTEAEQELLVREPGSVTEVMFAAAVDDYQSGPGPQLPVPDRLPSQLLIGAPLRLRRFRRFPVSWTGTGDVMWLRARPSDWGPPPSTRPMPVARRALVPSAGLALLYLLLIILDGKVAAGLGPKGTAARGFLFMGAGCLGLSVLAYLASGTWKTGGPRLRDVSMFVRRGRDPFPAQLAPWMMRLAVLGGCLAVAVATSGLPGAFSGPA